MADDPGRDATVDLGAVRAYLLDLQERVCAAIGGLDPALVWQGEELAGERGGLARPRVGGGAVFERAAVHFSHTVGEKLPAAATERLAELAGESFEAVSISLILHPQSPYVPTTHANLRCFAAGPRPAWWFGGGFDLTPYYGFEEDAVHWHRTARAACEPFGAELYPRYKAACDGYFHLPHRDEARGIGGLFFDDLREPSFDACFAFLRSVGDAFLPAYLPIVERRRGIPWGEREREFQLYRRGRYVEFNLLYDRGTRFGLQARGRVESILASLPPRVRWVYAFAAEPGSPEARLVEEFLRPRDWLAGVSSPAAG